MPAMTPGLLRHGPALRFIEHRHFDAYFREHLGPGVATRAVRSVLIARQARLREADRSTLWRPDVPHRGRRGCLRGDTAESLARSTQRRTLKRHLLEAKDHSDSRSLALFNDDWKSVDFSGN
jgi:hypothetical protein